VWVVFVMVAALARHGLVDPDVAIMGAITALCLVQIILPADLLSG
jgi:hypothetical protein